jgi:hypothetical protein
VQITFVGLETWAPYDPGDEGDEETQGQIERANPKAIKFAGKSSG